MSLSSNLSSKTKRLKSDLSQASDMRTVTGKSIARILDLCHIGTIADLSANTVKKRIKYAVIPDDETRRIGIIKDMLSHHSDYGLTSTETLEILEFACSS